MRDIRIAAAMTRSRVGDTAGNLARARNLAREAAGKGAQLLVLPEAGLTGYTVRESMVHLAEPVPGPLTAALVETARETGLLILAGLVERAAGGICYLTQVLAGPSGLLYAYRKTHLGPTEKTWFGAGDRLGLVSHGGLHMGLQLCYEGHFPEITLAQALAGVDLVLIPHASPRETPEEKRDRWLRYLPARAYDHTVFVAACNQAGDNGGGLEFAGVCLILGPKGEILAEAVGLDDQLVTADLRAADLASVREGRMGYFLPLRRPELYRQG
jgi:N-carbamoylputrescine amidase